MYFGLYYSEFPTPPSGRTAELNRLMQELPEALSCEDEDRKRSPKHQRYIRELEDRIVDIETEFLKYGTSII